MTELIMPSLSESMEEGTILRWLKHDGDAVAAREDLVEIETDKATVTHAAEASGTLQIVVAEGATVPVGTVIARLAQSVGTPPAQQAGAPPAQPAPGEVAPMPELDVGTADVPTPPPPGVAGTAGANGGGPPAGPLTPPSSQPLATPLARRTAREHGIELDELSGTGPRGRITRADVLAAAAGTDPLPPAHAPAHEVAAPPEAPIEASEIVQPTRLQQVIARRMAEAKATIPDFQVEVDAVMDRALAMRAELTQPEHEQPAPSITDFVVKACALALRRHPRVNASYRDGRFELHRRVNIGIAVASEDALTVPTICDADAKSLGAIATEARRLAARVRGGEITPGELSGATFTVSNLGMFGMTAIRPVINPPQAAILGVGAIREVLARTDGEITDRRLLTLTLTADHRILYGADAARFLADVKALLETPLRLAL